MTKNITDQELDALLREDARITAASIPEGGHRDVTPAVMQRVRKMAFLLPSYNPLLRRRRLAVAAVAVIVLLTTTGAGLGHYQSRVADEQLASMFSTVYDFHADYGQDTYSPAGELELAYL